MLLELEKHGLVFISDLFSVTSAAAADQADLTITIPALVLLYVSEAFHWASMATIHIVPGNFCVSISHERRERSSVCCLYLVYCMLPFFPSVMA